MFLSAIDAGLEYLHMIGLCTCHPIKVEPLPVGREVVAPSVYGKISALGFRRCNNCDQDQGPGEQLASAVSGFVSQSYSHVCHLVKEHVNTLVFDMMRCNINKGPPCGSVKFIRRLERGQSPLHAETRDLRSSP